MKKTYDIVSIVLNEATKRFNDLFSEDPACRNVIRQYCEALDTIAEEFEGIALDVEVDEDKKTICLGFTCDYVAFEGIENNCALLIANALSTRITSNADNVMVIEFVFGGIWDRRN